MASKFYLDKRTYELGTYPIYPAGGAYVASSSMVYLLLRLMRKYELFSFPFEGLGNEPTVLDRNKTFLDHISICSKQGLIPFIESTLAGLQEHWFPDTFGLFFSCTEVFTIMDEVIVFQTP